MNMTESNTLDEDAAVQLKVTMETIVMEYLGLNAALAGPFAATIVDGMRKKMGGNRVYIPASKTKKATVNDCEARDREILRMYNGRNMEDVMKLFGVSRRSVFRAVQRARRNLVPPSA